MSDFNADENDVYALVVMRDNTLEKLEVTDSRDDAACEAEFLCRELCPRYDWWSLNFREHGVWFSLDGIKVGVVRADQLWVTK